MSDKKFITLVVGLVVVIAVFRVTSLPVYASPEIQDRLLREQRALMEVRKYVYDYYYKDVDEDTLFYGALQGMVDQLARENDDPYSRFLPPEQAQRSQEQIKGSFGGIGISIEEVNGLPQIIVPILDTPADRAGLLPGDVIIAVDNIPLQTTAERTAIDQAVQAMRGPAGSEVALTVRRTFEGNTSDVHFRLKREEIHKDSVMLTQMFPVDGAPGGPKIGYTRLSEFSSNCSGALRDALDNLIGQGAEGLIVDLRHNPGGLLDEAVNIADLWIDPKDTLRDVDGNRIDGVIVSTRPRGPGAKAVNTMAKPNDRSYPRWLVLLVDHDSASASEVLSGALKDYGKAVLVGRKTWGKGVVQSLFPIDLPPSRKATAERGPDDPNSLDPTAAHGTLKLTTASYFTPRGVSIHKVGIEPDVWVSVDPVQAVQAFHDEDIAWELDRFRRTHRQVRFAVPARADGQPRPTLEQALREDVDIATSLEVLRELIAGQPRADVIRKADAVGRLAEDLRSSLADTGLPYSPPEPEAEE